MTGRRLNSSTLIPPSPTAEQVWAAVNGDLEVTHYGFPVIKPLSIPQKRDFQRAVDFGWVICNKEENLASGAFWWYCAALGQPYVRVTRRTRSSGIDADIATCKQQNFTENAARQIYTLFRRYGQPDAIFHIDDRASISRVDRRTDEQVARSLRDIALIEGSLTTEITDFNYLWDELLNGPKTKTSQQDAYDTYLHSSAWRKKRADALLVAGYRCQLCGVSGVPLYGHHNTYESFGDEQPGDVIALCQECHNIGDRMRRSRKSTDPETPLQ